MKRLYVIVQALSEEVLEERVNERRKVGFELIGGIAVVYHSDEKCLYFYQAMQWSNPISSNA